MCVAGMLFFGTVKAGESSCSHALELDRQEAIELVTMEQLADHQACRSDSA